MQKRGYAVVRNIPSKQIKLKYNKHEALEEFFVEINLRVKKWGFYYSYNPNKNNIFYSLCEKCPYSGLF